MVGETEKNKKARELKMLKEAMEDARENPGFKFDWTYMHALDKIIDHPNLWFLEIL